MNIIGTGTDIIEIDRIAKAIERWGKHFVEHIFTPSEIEYANTHKNSAQHFAVRFAAKEAIYKAVSRKPNLGWKDIEILKDSFGKPCCTLKDLDEFENCIVHLSLSHSKKYAIANAIITSK